MLRSLKTVKQVILPAALLISTLAFAQFRTVTVQNANDNPVPTTVQNMPPVTINGTVPVTGTVDATIVNTPTVNVKSGTINATIANEPTVMIDGTVNISGAVTSSIINEPTVKVDPAFPVPVTGAVNATISNEPLVKVDGIVPVSGTVNSVITNMPTVKVDGSVPIPVTGAVNATISNEPMVKVDGIVPVSGTVNSVITNVPTVRVDGTVATSGTVNAVITNTPTVNVNGNVPVTISGTPAVSVSNLPLGVAGPQNTTVVLVKSVDGALSLQPLQVPFTCTTGSNGSCTSSFNIPQGKVFVAEYMQATAQEPPAVNALYFRLQTTSGGQTMSYTYEPGAQIVGQGFKMRTSEHLVRIYADAGSTMSLSGFADTTGMPGGLSVSVIVSGQLVNAQ
jgi:hypothetical protein